MTVALWSAVAALGLLWLPAAAACWWKLRTDQALRQCELDDTQFWLDTCPMLLVRALAPLLERCLPAAWEFTCVINGLSWPVRDLQAWLSGRRYNHHG